MKEITVQELKSKIDNKENFQLIDIREDNERAFTNIGGDHITMASLIPNLDKIRKDAEEKAHRLATATGSDILPSYPASRERKEDKVRHERQTLIKNHRF